MKFPKNNRENFCTITGNCFCITGNLSGNNKKKRPSMQIAEFHTPKTPFLPQNELLQFFREN
jgi:hypothetical protein